MATQPDDNEPLDLTEDMEVPDAEDQADEQEQSGEEEGDDEQERVTFADEEDAEPPEENSVIRQMRAELKEERRRRLEAEQKSAPVKIEVGPEPELWDDDIAGDEQLFKKRVLEWHENKAAAARQEESQAEQDRKINEAWLADIATFEQKKGGLAFEDRDEAIEGVIASLPRNWQLPAIIKAANDPALFFYALSKSPTKLAELVKFEDPIKMGAAVARMEGAVKVTKGRKAPEPDRPLRGSAQMPGGADKQLEKLEKEAERLGGDRSKIIAYKAAQAAKVKGK